MITKDYKNSTFSGARCRDRTYDIRRVKADDSSDINHLDAVNRIKTGRNGVSRSTSGAHALTDYQVTQIRTQRLEEWRAIVGYEGMYEVSNLGRVRSVDHRVRMARGSRLFPGKVIYQSKNRRYSCVRLSKPGLIKTFDVHRLVAQAFLPGSGPVVRHLDDDGHNNIWTNLAWGTYKDNSADAIERGRTSKGEAHGMAVLNEAVVREIRGLHKDGLTAREIAKRVGFSKSLVKHVICNEAWTHVV